MDGPFNLSGNISTFSRYSSVNHYKWNLQAGKTMKSYETSDTLHSHTTRKSLTPPGNKNMKNWSKLLKKLESFIQEYGGIPLMRIRSTVSQVLLLEILLRKSEEKTLMILIVFFMFMEIWGHFSQATRFFFSKIWRDSSPEIWKKNISWGDPFEEIFLRALEAKFPQN